MYRDGDVVAKGKVVEHVDSEEHQGTQDRSSQRESAPLEKEGWTAGGEVSWPSDQGCYDELDKGDEEPFVVLRFDSPEARQGLTYHSLVPI